MEYAGTGSFWSQLAAPANGADPLSNAVPVRRIDELLRSPISSLVDILLDEEAISEFRSANQKMIGRVTSFEGMKLIIDAILNLELPETLTDAQKLQLPFIATEFVACEVEELLEGLVRLVPGQKTPLERLFDFLVDQRSSRARSTILGYVCRVIAILVSRKGAAVEKHLEASGPLLLEALIDLSYDRSVCDLILKLLLDDEMRYFPKTFEFSSLYMRWKDRSGSNPIVCVFDTFFGRMLIPTDRLIVIWNKMVSGENFIQNLTNPPYSKYQLDIVRILLGFSFLPHQVVVGFSQFPTPQVSSTFWESTVPKMEVPSPVVEDSACNIGSDDDVVMGDDGTVEEDVRDPVETKKVVPSDTLCVKYKSSAFTDFGCKLADAVVAQLEDVCALACASGSSLPLVYSVCQLLCKLVKIGVSMDAFAVKYCSEIMFIHSSSSALHNVITEILIASDARIVNEIFVPCATSFLEKATAKNGGCYGHICRIFSHFKGAIESDLVDACAAQWTVCNARLDTAHSAVPSPKTGMPKIDDEMDTTGWGPRMYQANRSLDDELDNGL